jgi:hypothetical protein
MENTFLQTQSPKEPLFSDIAWSRPETKQNSGRLCIVGGNAQAFSSVGVSYDIAIKARVGTITLALPDKLSKVVKTSLTEAIFVPSTPSGSFAVKALGELLPLANNSDACLLAGDFGRNSETAVLLEKLTEKYSGILIVAQDAVDYFKQTPKLLVDRPDTLMVLSIEQLQKIFINTPVITPITFGMNFSQLAEALHAYTKEHNACMFITFHNGVFFIAGQGRVVTCRLQDVPEIWRTQTATRAGVFWLQNPSRALEAVATSILDDSVLSSYN